MTNEILVLLEERNKLSEINYHVEYMVYWELLYSMKKVGIGRKDKILIFNFYKHQYTGIEITKCKKREAKNKNICSIRILEKLY